MKNTAIILGLGPSVKLFTENPALQRHFAGAAIFGVNDIWKHYPVPHLLILDGEEKFSPERRTTILNSKPEHLYLWTLDKWPTMPNREYLGPITDFAGDLTVPHLQKPKVISSTWVAAQCAWLKGYRRIILFGADYTQHPNLSEQRGEIADGYYQLAKAIKKAGGELFIYKNSCAALQNFIFEYEKPRAKKALFYDIDNNYVMPGVFTSDSTIISIESSDRPEITGTYEVVKFSEENQQYTVNIKKVR